MCGRFTLRTPTNLLVQQFLLDSAPALPPRYNIAPTQQIAAVRKTSDDPQRHLVLLHWGLIPSWADDAKIGSRMINARGETVAEKPAFRAAFKRRRCLVPADGYYEWKKPAGGKGKSNSGGKKQPYYITMADDRPFAFAGLWEYWEGASAEGPIESCTIITTDANQRTAEIHDRMPVILHEDDYELWLDPELQEKKPLLPLLKPYASDEMQATPVSTHVNNPRNDDPRCIEAQRELFDR